MFVCLTGLIVYELLSIPFCCLTCYFLKNGFHGKIGRDGQVCVDSFCDLKRHLSSPLNYFYSSEPKTASLARLRLCLENGSRKYCVCDQGDCWTKFPVGELLLMWPLPTLGALGGSQGCVPVSYCAPGLRHSPQSTYTWDGGVPGKERHRHHECSVSTLGISAWIELTKILLFSDVGKSDTFLEFSVNSWGRRARIFMVPLCSRLLLTPITNIFWKMKVIVAQSCPILATPRARAARLLCPWDFPGRHTGVGCHLLLQGILLIQESNPGLLHSTRSPALQANSAPTEPPGKPQILWLFHKTIHIFLLLCGEDSEMAWDSLDFFFSYRNASWIGKSTKENIFVIEADFISSLRTFSWCFCAAMRPSICIFLCPDILPTTEPVFTNKVIQVNKVSLSLITPVCPNSWLFKTAFSSTLIPMQKFWHHRPGSVEWGTKVA